ncbi:hypothetical protein [Undibacterium sp. Ji49W]|uniref:hypothetical protein n=1 Tax=Undibacterium sp. Ji49W TaxID=3413040 RepID=UPI003BF22BFD
MNFLPRICILLTALTTLATLTSAPVTAASDTAKIVYEPPLTNVAMDKIVQSELYPQLAYLAQKLLAEKENTTLNGYPAFNGKDKFLPGKIASGLGHLLLNAKHEGKDLAPYLRDFRESAELIVGMDNHTWGIYYYLLTLYELKKNGLLEQALTAKTLDALKKKLDWRSFVTQTDFKLIQLPTNYYGVAFGVARLRMLLGWEDETASQRLLKKLLDHYEQHSGTYGFSDETEGEGRFDRYSILLISEICGRFIETGMEVTPELKIKLRKATDIAFRLGNVSGDGFSFGRSIGAYGETAVLDILTVSAYLSILSPQEKEYAYAYSTRIVAKYVDFWYDKKTRSVDLWGQGRKTDDYRGIHRILGENFSLLHQLISANDLWRQMGYQDTLPKQDLAAWLNQTQPVFEFTWFARGEYDRALAIYRDAGHVFSLLMVNGGASQHGNSPYYPLPFSNLLVAGIADSGYQHPQLLPKFTLNDGSELIATAFIKNIRNTKNQQTYEVSYHQDSLTRIGPVNQKPVPDARIQLNTSYRLGAGTITRTDQYLPTEKLGVRQVSLEFASFSEMPEINGNTIRFNKGDLSEFTVTGMDHCSARASLDTENFKSPNGPMKTLVSCERKAFSFDTPITISWSIKYH